MTHQNWMEIAVDLACENVSETGGKPFGAVIVRNGEIVGEGVNKVNKTNDPTAHAELLAIQEAAEKLGNSDLSDCELYASGEPCPMCLGAIYWANIKAVYYAYGLEDAEKYNLSSAYFYQQIALPREKRDITFVQVRDEHDGKNPFELWVGE